MVCQFTKFIEIYLRENELMKCLATLMRFNVFSVLKVVCEAYHLGKERKEFEYDIKNVYWCVFEIAQALRQFFVVRICEIWVEKIDIFRHTCRVQL